MPSQTGSHGRSGVFALQLLGRTMTADAMGGGGHGGADEPDEPDKGRCGLFKVSFGRRSWGSGRWTSQCQSQLGLVRYRRQGSGFGVWVSDDGRTGAGGTRWEGKKKSWTGRLGGEADSSTSDLDLGRKIVPTTSRRFQGIAGPSRRGVAQPEGNRTA